MQSIPHQIRQHLTSICCVSFPPYTVIENSPSHEHFPTSLLKGCLNYKTFTLRHHDTHISHHAALIILSASLSSLPSSGCHPPQMAAAVSNDTRLPPLACIGQARFPANQICPGFRLFVTHPSPKQASTEYSAFSYRVPALLSFAITSIISILIVTHPLFSKRTL